MICEPTCDHVTPSLDWYAEIAVPTRVSFTQYGAGTMSPAVLRLVAPADGRRWKLFPFAGVTIMVACAAPGVRSPRIMTPALTHALVFCTVTTRATICPSPFSG